MPGSGAGDRSKVASPTGEGGETRVEFHVVLLDADGGADFVDVLARVWDAHPGQPVVVHGLTEQVTPRLAALSSAVAPTMRFVWHADRRSALAALVALVAPEDLVWFPAEMSALSPTALDEALAAFERHGAATVAAVREIGFDDLRRRLLGPPIDTLASVLDGQLPIGVLIFSGRAFAGGLKLLPAQDRAPAALEVLLPVLSRPGRVVGLFNAHLTLAHRGQVDGMGAGPRLARAFLERWRLGPLARKQARVIIEGWTDAFALVEMESETVTYLSDPAGAVRQTSLDAFLNELLAYTLPNRVSGQPPPTLVVARPGAMAALRAARLDAWLFADLGAKISEATMVAYRLEHSQGTRLEIVDSPEMLPADVIAIKANTVAEVAVKAGIEWLATALRPQPDFAHRTVRIRSPLLPEHAETLPALEPDPAQSALLRLCVRLRRRLPPGHPPDLIADEWQRGAVQGCIDRLCWLLLGEGQFAFRGGTRRDRLDIVMGLPIFSFGGVERVSLRVAEELRRLGNRTSVVVTRHQSVESHKEVAAAFDEIHVLPAKQDAPESLWNEPGALRRIASIVGQADVFVPSHVADWAALSPTLRSRSGIMVPYLHLHDAEIDGAPTGHAHMTRDGMGAADGAIVISRQLANWMTASGFRRDRICVAPNGPSRAFPAATLAAAVAAKIDRPATGPLRVLYIGRLDAEKGLDRLGEIAREADRSEGQLDLRFVGAPVLAGRSLPPALERRRLPPVFDDDELAEHFAWADVQILASHREGVPLVILEAMAFGCVPVVTAVGAVDEVVQHGVNGLLVDNHADDVAGELIAHLHGLQRNRADLVRLAQAAAASVPEDGWRHTVSGIDTFLGRLVQTRTGRAA
ncbi:MAG: glycosyl transferase [Enterovirga sp.]|nr:glycosyl transferase [Enterovirga sp.]